jgi:hypothetical protein
MLSGSPFTLGQSTFRSTAGVVLFIGLSNVWEGK